MLDKKIVPLIKPPLKVLAMKLDGAGVRADNLTIAGFVIGLLCVVAIATGHYMIGLVLLLINRLFDGLDGELARLHTPTDAGGFLDITLDFFFYALFPIGFAFADPAQNALPAAVLIASFIGTGASFLAFSSFAQKHAMEHPDFAYKSLFYLNGLAEGTETILCFVLMCLMPYYFAAMAWFFAIICIITAINRVWFGYLTLLKHADTNNDH